jgi:nicotianamine synthase
MNDMDIYQKLKSFNNYKPSTEVSQTFSALVAYCLNSNNKIHLDPDQIIETQKICSLAEEELEFDFANKIISNEKTLEEFMYYPNYQDQINLEIESLRTLNRNIKKILFVGGGPLPLTAILLAKNYDIDCDVIEKDKEYAALSEKLIRKLEIENLKIINTEALDYGGYANYDLVIISALSQSNALSKESLINQISSLTPLTLARYATGNKILLYPDLNKSIINNIALVVNPTGNIINSFLIIKN